VESLLLMLLQLQKNLLQKPPLAKSLLAKNQLLKLPLQKLVLPPVVLVLKFLKVAKRANQSRSLLCTLTARSSALRLNACSKKMKRPLL